MSAAAAAQTRCAAHPFLVPLPAAGCPLCAAAAAPTRERRPITFREPRGRAQRLAMIRDAAQRAGRARPTPEVTMEPTKPTNGAAASAAVVSEPPTKPAKKRKGMSPRESGAKGGKANTRILLTHDGATRSLSEWAPIVGMSAEGLRKRMQAGLSPAEVLSPGKRPRAISVAKKAKMARAATTRPPKPPATPRPSSPTSPAPKPATGLMVPGTAVDASSPARAPGALLAVAGYRVLHQQLVPAGVMLIVAVQAR